jgi:protein-S-isoprenylcysteine O-methyltransferase Ste14
LTLSIFILGFTIGLYALLHNKIGDFNICPDMKEEKIWSDKNSKYIDYMSKTKHFFPFLF